MLDIICDKILKSILVVIFIIFSYIIIMGTIALYIGADKELELLEDNYRRCKCKGKIYIERLEEG